MAKIRVNITIEQEILEKGKEIAKSQNRTLSNYIETLIINGMSGDDKVEVKYI